MNFQFASMQDHTGPDGYNSKKKKSSSSGSGSSSASSSNIGSDPFNNDSPSMFTPDTIPHADDHRSSTPKTHSTSSGEQKPGRKRAKKNGGSSSSAAGQDRARRNAAKQSKFIQKVYEMASAEGNQEALGFSDDGLALEIRDVPALGNVLGRYFKHSNPSSFIRQLNNYGFKTISSSTLGSNRHVFAHPHFKRDDSSLLETITRKTAVCVKKKSKGEIIRELQQKNDEQQQQLQQMEMQHLEMFQRIMAVEAENKQLRNHLEIMRRSFQEAGLRMDHHRYQSGMDMQMPPAAAQQAYSQRFRNANARGNASSMNQGPIYDNMGNPHYPGLEANRMSYGPVVETSQDKDISGFTDPFHLD